MRHAMLTVALGGMLLSVPAHADTETYKGVCDASAAIALDAQRFVVAEDEHDTLHVYKRGAPGAVDGLDLTDYLKNREDDGEAKEADLEGAARLGERIFWIASHGRNKNGKFVRQRLRFFATPIEDGVVTLPSAPAYTMLLNDLIGEAKFAELGFAEAAEEAPEDPAGLNIEGLAAGPEGGLLIAFRNPRPENKAVVIPLANPAEVLDERKRPVFGEAILLDLGGRGIRSIERLGDRYLLVAGPFGDADAAFQLYSWSGAPGDAPSPIAADFGTMRPEALFAWPGGNEIDVLSDDGSVPVDGKECKDVSPAKASFRAMTIDLAKPRQKAAAAAEPAAAMEPAALAAPDDAALVASAEQAYAAKIAGGGRYMEQNCAPVAVAGWENFPTRRCTYTNLGATASVTLLDPDAKQLARWTVAACRAAAAQNMQACIDYLIARTWDASNAQFPVTGFVIEPASVLGGSSNEPRCFLFRDGVTIRTATVSTRRPVEGRCGPESAETEPATRAFKYARISSTTREELAEVPGQRQHQDLAFLDAVRAAYQQAWNADANALMTAAALAGKRAGAYP